MSEFFTALRAPSGGLNSSIMDCGVLRVGVVWALQPLRARARKGCKAQTYEDRLADIREQLDAPSLADDPNGV